MHGRLATPPPARSIVFVKRSGMDMRRFAPSPLSLRKPPMMVRCERSEDHTAATGATSQPCASICFTSSSYMACVKTDPTLTSRSPGASMKPSTPSMSEMYLGSGCVRKYSNGLLFTAAMFQERVESVITRRPTIACGSTKSERSLGVAEFRAVRQDGYV